MIYYFGLRWRLARLLRKYNGRLMANPGFTREVGSIVERKMGMLIILLPDSW